MRGELRRLAGTDPAKLVPDSGLLAGAGGTACSYAALGLDDTSKIKPIAVKLAPAVAVGVVLAGVVLFTGDKPVAR